MRPEAPVASGLFARPNMSNPRLTSLLHQPTQRTEELSMIGYNDMLQQQSLQFLQPCSLPSLQQKLSNPPPPQEKESQPEPARLLPVVDHAPVNDLNSSSSISGSQGSVDELKVSSRPGQSHRTPSNEVQSGSNSKILLPYLASTHAKLSEVPCSKLPSSDMLQSFFEKLQDSSNNFSKQHDSLTRGK